MTRDPLRPLPISGVFPLLADPQWGAGRYGVSPDSDVRSLAGDSGRTSLLAVVSGLLDVGRELPVLALVPAIAAVLGRISSAGAVGCACLESPSAKPRAQALA